MFCSRCGAQLTTPNAAFCSSCGSPLALATSAPASPTGQSLNLKVGGIKGSDGGQFTVSLFVDEKRRGHIVLGIFPEDDDEDPQVFFTDMSGLMALKQLLVQTERTVEQTQKEGRISQLGY